MECSFKNSPVLFSDFKSQLNQFLENFVKVLSDEELLEGQTKQRSEFQEIERKESQEQWQAEHLKSQRALRKTLVVDMNFRD